MYRVPYTIHTLTTHSLHTHYTLTAHSLYTRYTPTIHSLHNPVRLLTIALAMCPVAVCSRVLLSLSIQLTNYLQVPPHSEEATQATCDYFTVDRLQSMHYSLCTTAYALQSMRYSLCTTVYALQSMHYSLCTTVYALQSMHYSLCTTVYALQSMHYSLCATVYALQSMHYSLCATVYARIAGQPPFAGSSVAKASFHGLMSASVGICVSPLVVLPARHARG
jgi:hypothetical protein